MNIDVKRLPDAGMAQGGIGLDDELAISCPQRVAALRFTFSFDANEIRETDDGEFVAMLHLTRDEAHEFATAITDCTCDG